MENESDPLGKYRSAVSSAMFLAAFAMAALAMMRQSNAIVDDTLVSV